MVANTASGTSAGAYLDAGRGEQPPEHEVQRVPVVCLDGVDLPTPVHFVKVEIAATRAAENGATVAELNAIFAWTGTAMALLYTQAADRKRLARRAMPMLDAALGNESATPMHAPTQEVRAPAAKQK